MTTIPQKTAAALRAAGYTYAQIADQFRMGPAEAREKTQEPPPPPLQVDESVIGSIEAGRRPQITQPAAVPDAAGLLPGDFAVVDISGLGGKLIGAMERIAYSHATPWEHAFIYVGDGRIVQAEPGGAQNVPLGSYNRILWSTGLLAPTDEQRAKICASALHYAADKVGYSYADYLAIAAHRAHIWTPGLREYIASTGHQICSQLVDQCWHDAGYQLFDKRWAGYVTPYDLGALLTDIMFRTGKFAR